MKSQNPILAIGLNLLAIVTMTPLHAETNTPPEIIPLAAITNGMTRLEVEKIIPAFTNRTETFMNPGGICSQYWLKDGKTFSVVYDWRGSSWGTPKASPENRVTGNPLWREQSVKGSAK